MKGEGAKLCSRDGDNFSYKNALSMNPPIVTSDTIKLKKFSNDEADVNQYLHGDDNILNDWYNSDSIVLRDIPLQKWNFVVIILEDQTVDVYFNGKLAKSLKLPSPVITGGSEADLIIGDDEGFGGSLTSLTVYERALTPEEVQALYMEGYSSGDSLANELSGLIPQITMPKITFKKTKF